jgi:hypothetical protein
MHLKKGLVDVRCGSTATGAFRPLPNNVRYASDTDQNIALQ